METYWGSYASGLHPETIVEYAKDGKIPAWLKGFWSQQVGGDIVELATTSERAARRRRHDVNAAIFVMFFGMLCFSVPYIYGCHTALVSTGCSLLLINFNQPYVTPVIVASLLGLIIFAMAGLCFRRAWRTVVHTKLFTRGAGLKVFRIAQVIGPNPTDINQAAAAKLIEIATEMNKAAKDMSNALHDFTWRQAEDTHGRLWQKFDKLRAIFADGHLVSPTITPAQLLAGENGGAIVQMRPPA